MTRGEEQELEQTFKTPPARRLRDRCQAILLVARGRARHVIAHDLGGQRTTLRLGGQTYRERGMPGLKIQWASGQPQRIPAALAATSVAWVKGGPARCGLQRANWTYAELAAYWDQQTGRAVSETTRRECCHRHQMRPYRPTDRSWRGDPQRQAQAQAEVTEEKKSTGRGERLIKAR